MRVFPASDQPPEHGFLNSWICKNSAYRAVLSNDDAFAKRCSCCICYLFDENKDPSLWLVCTSESGDGNYSGCSCHIECALQHEKVGVVDLGQLMQLDRSYCCASCGKVSGILGCWKKQLSVAKDARSLDVLCHRIYLSYRLLDSTSRFKELHEFVKDMKAKLQTEVGSMNEVSAKMAREIVSRLSVAGDIQKLCSLAIGKVDEWLATMSNTNPKSQDSRPAACRFLFEDVKLSVIMVLVELSTVSSDYIEGYKLCDDIEKCCAASKIIEPETRKDSHMASVSRGIDLNVASIPDLNEELTPPLESSRNEENGYTLEQAMEADDDAASHE
ncbi:VIN3-like protein 1 [Hibiscus syriacus]|uniref:VIN3-like protein 1 n=1 Tax=Hibiscus syriacus TaxID=106335 RepID=A0A6A2YAI1_HIBSY|nr:VIN3-like protein 1 [Hibiscus syriacus]